MSAEVGAKAPDFNLIDTEGNNFGLDSLAGNPVVLAFFPAAFSGVCAEELCTFRDALADYSGFNAAVVGISIDGRFANAEFKEKNNLDFPILSDYQQKAINDYDVVWPNFAGMDGYTTARRSVFILNSNGNIAWKWLSDVPSDLPPFDEVKAQIEALG